MAKYLGYFNIFPKELFRMSNSRIIRVRDGAVKKTGSIDVISEDGKLKPKALQSDTYSSPNGISMRPNTEFQHANVSTFRGKKLIVYCVPAETKLPDNLVLVLEHHDHYSLQPAEEMTVKDMLSSFS